MELSFTQLANMSDNWACATAAGELGRALAWLAGSNDWGTARHDSKMLD